MQYVRNVRQPGVFHLDEDLLALLQLQQLDDFHRKRRLVSRETLSMVTPLVPSPSLLRTILNSESAGSRPPSRPSSAHVLHLAHGHLLTRGRLRGTVGQLVDAQTGEAAEMLESRRSCPSTGQRALRAAREAIVPGSIDGERDTFLRPPPGGAGSTWLWVHQHR